MIFQGAKSGGKISGSAIGRTQRCANCGCLARVYKSEEITVLIRDLVFQCTNNECGVRWNAQISPIRVIVPPEIERPGFQHLFPDPKSGANQTEKYTQSPPDENPYANGMAAASCG
jgi:hypothetical protein